MAYILRAQYQLLFSFREKAGGTKPNKGRLISVTCLPVPPEMTVFPNKPVELGEPNILICFIDKFSPPVVNVTWFQNGKPVTTGVSETVFLPRQDHLFRKFYYLPFLPSNEDFYDCKVEHWGLEEPLIKHWGMDQPPLFFCVSFCDACIWSFGTQRHCTIS